MPNIENELFVSPEAFDKASASDREAIQCAVDEAASRDVGRVVIPRRNARTGEEIWRLDGPVRLPSGMTVVLDDCVIESAGGVFVNSHNGDGGKNSLGGEQPFLFVVGLGRAVLRAVGGAPGIVDFYNVCDFRVEGVAFEGQACGVRLAYARQGRVLRCTYGGVPQGVFIGPGCKNLIVENQAGRLGESLVSLLSHEDADGPMGKPGAVHDIILARLEGASEQALVRLEAPGGAELYNIVVRDVTCTSPGAHTWAVQLGGGPEDGLRDVTVRGVRSAAGGGVRVASPLFHCWVSGIAVSEGMPDVRADRPEYLVSCRIDRESVLPVEKADAAPPSRPPARFYTPNDPAYFADSDARTIQNAVDAASADGVNCVVIPRRNARTGGTVWSIGETIRLPSHMTVVLQSCHLRQEDWCYCNMFSNAEAYTELGKSMDGRQEDITITGFGDAVLDGGKHNGLLEKTAGKNGFPRSMMCNAMIYFHHVNKVTVENIFILQQRWYGVNFMHCSQGHVSNLEFYARELVPNLDGVDLRTGCSDFLIENIMGTLSDDVVAMNLIGYGGAWQVEGLETHTHDVLVRNVIADACRWNIVRLLNHDGNRLYNITLDTILDASLTEYKKTPKAAVRIGANDYAQFYLAGQEDMSDIVLRDIYSRAERAVDFSGRSARVDISNVHVFGDGREAISTYDRAEVQDVRIDGVFFGKNQRSLFLGGPGLGRGELTDREKYTGTALKLSDFAGRDILIENVWADRVAEAVRLTGGAAVEVKNLTVREYGADYAVCDTKSTLVINGVPIAKTEYVRL